MIPQLSNIREFLGWVIGHKVVDVTSGDPKEIPDSDEEDGHYIVLHFDNGGTFEVPVGDEGFTFFNPNEE